MKFRQNLVALLVLPLSAIAQSVVVNDSAWSTPVSNSYTGDTSGLNYYGSSGSSGQLNTTGGMLSLATSSSGRGLSLVFPTQTLSNIGDTLSFSASFKITTPLLTNGTNNFRIGIMNSSGGTTITTNGYNNTNANFVGYEGYMAASSIGIEDSTPSKFFKKLTAGNAIIGSTTGLFSDLADGGIDLGTGVETPVFAAGIDYVISLIATSISGGGVNLAYSLTGGDVGSVYNFNADDATASTLSFDTLALHVNSNSWTTTDLQNVNVTYTAFSAVPEPNTFALLFGMMALGFVGARRRRVAVS